MQFIPVDTVNSRHFSQISNGTKSLVTRHNKEYTSGVFYKDSKKGDLLEIIDSNTKTSILAEVIETQYFLSLQELFDSKLADESFGKVFRTKEELAAEYEKNRPGYSVLLDRDGIVTWRFVVKARKQ